MIKFLPKDKKYKLFLTFEEQRTLYILLEKLLLDRYYNQIMRDLNLDHEGYFEDLKNILKKI
jgi:hypothetical protein